MKKLTIIAAAILLLSACRKEDDKVITPVTNYTVSGTWKLVQEVKDETVYMVDSTKWIFNQTNCSINLAPYTIDNTTSFITFQADNEDAVEASFTTYVQTQDSNSLELFRNDSTTLIFVR